jgi:hypothetical protein
MKPKKNSLIGKLTFLFILMLVAVVPTVSHALTFTVNSTADVAGLQANCINAAGTVPAPQCTLRSAIQAANASLTVADTINLPAGTYTLTIPGRNLGDLAGDLNITGLGVNALTIVGTGLTPGATIIDGGGIDRVFNLNVGNASVTISNVTIKGGNSAGAVGGGILTGGNAILNLNNVIITGNTTGVANIEGDALSIGGGGAAVTMSNVAIMNNGGTIPGGGSIIGVGAAPTNLKITNGTISGHFDTAIGNAGVLILTNVTISGNTAINAAAIDNNKATGTVSLQNCTINGNTANAVGNVGGIRNLAAAANVTARNTIISNNGPVNCNVLVTSLGNNLSSNAECVPNTPVAIAAGDVINTDPQLVPTLALNGATFLTTHALLAGSPAIDTGTATGCPAVDERGIARPVDGNPVPPAVTAICDKGAFEFRPQQITVTLAPPFDFGTVTSATTADHLITLANAGDGALVLGPIAVTDPLAAPFSIPINNCPAGLSLPLGGTCTFTARFAPTAAGAAADAFNIPSNDPITPAVSFALTGAGTAVTVPGILVTDSITPNNDSIVPFGGVAVGASADATITVTNTGTANLVVGTIASADPLAAPFSILSNTCSGATVAPTATCTLTVRFAPTANGAASDTFDIPSTGLPTVTVSVSGSGGIVTTPAGTPAGTPTGTVNNPPTNPELVFPGDALTGLGTSVQFIWKKSVDPDSDAVHYHLIYSTDPNFASPQTVEVAFAKTGLLFAGLGSMGGGIILFGFVAGNGSLRSRKLLLAIPLLLMGALFTACGGGGGGAPSTTAPTVGTDEATTTVTGLAAKTTYYWKVVADDGKGGQSSSAVRSFTTQ